VAVKPDRWWREWWTPRPVSPLGETLWFWALCIVAGAGFALVVLLL